MGKYGEWTKKFKKYFINLGKCGIIIKICKEKQRIYIDFLKQSDYNI